MKHKRLRECDCYCSCQKINHYKVIGNIVHHSIMKTIDQCQKCNVSTSVEAKKSLLQYYTDTGESIINSKIHRIAPRRRSKKSNSPSSTTRQQQDYHKSTKFETISFNYSHKRSRRHNDSYPIRYFITYQQLASYSFKVLLLSILLLLLLQFDTNRRYNNNSLFVNAWSIPLSWNSINIYSRQSLLWTESRAYGWSVLNHRHSMSTSEQSNNYNTFTTTDVRQRNDDDNINSIGSLMINDSVKTTMYHNNTIDGNHSVRNYHEDNTESFWVQQNDNENIFGDDDDDVPRLTENGGYSHTQASRAKISAANKGKVPWNKGLNRTDEVKARIAAGVRAKNRERFLQKLSDMGLTEEEYEERKRKERIAKEAERRARRTENGGYRPTEETKRKISNILKQKFAAGEIKPRPINPIHVRRGFTHSEETRQKISESLRKRWASDPEYRAKMIDVSTRVNTKEEVRQKISESLRNKWQSDDSFRIDMMNKIASRKRRIENDDGTFEICHHDESHRAKISAAMKAKWQDVEYREKTLQSLASRRTQQQRQEQPTRKQKITKPPIQKAIPLTPKKSSSLTKADVTKIDSPIQPKQDTLISQPIRSSSNNKDELQPKVSKVGTKKVKDDDSDVDEIVMIQPVQPRTVPRKKLKKVEGQVTKSNDSDDTDTNSLVHTNHSDSVDVVDINSRFSEKVVPKKKVLDDILSLNTNNIVNSFDLLPDINPIKKEPKPSSISGETTTVPTTKSTTTTNSVSNNGNVELLKTERRDLYDLLYGDEVEVDDDDDDSGTTTHHQLDDRHHRNINNNNNDIYNDDEMKMTGNTSPTLASIFARLEDDNLDTFDPYGLDDF